MLRLEIMREKLFQIQALFLGDYGSVNQIFFSMAFRKLAEYKMPFPIYLRNGFNWTINNMPKTVVCSQ